MKINLKYIAHFSLWTGKMEETIEVEDRITIGDLVNQLKGKYSKFKNALIDEKTGELNPRNRIAFKEAQGRVKNISNLDELDAELSEGDTLILW